MYAHGLLPERFRQLHFVARNTDKFALILPKPESMCKLVVKKRMYMCILKKLRQKVTVQDIKGINICKKAMNCIEISKKSIPSVINILFHRNPPIIMNPDKLLNRQNWQTA